MRQIVLVAHNLRSTHNVGSLLRTADGLGINRVILTGYTPYPSINSDRRLPHISTKLNRQIHKTALGAENSIDWSYNENVYDVLSHLHAQGYEIAALEQSENSVALPDFKASNKIAVIVGREVEGLEEEVLRAADIILEIPMQGTKESYNVAIAAALALYHIKYYNN